MYAQTAIIEYKWYVSKAEFNVLLKYWDVWEGLGNIVL